MFAPGKYKRKFIFIAESMTTTEGEKTSEYWSFLSKFDIFFGQRAFLYIRKRDEQTSNVSGALTIAMIVLLVIITGGFCYEMVSRQVVTIKYNTYDNLDEGIQLNPSNFMFAIGFENISFPEINRVFDIKFELRRVTRDEYGFLTKKDETHSLYPCKKENFQSQSYNFEREFQKYGLKTMGCPNVPAIDLKGSYLMDEFAYLRMNVVACQNSTENGFSCLSKEEAVKFIRSHEIRLQFFYIDNIINPSSYERPIVPYLTNQQWLLSPLKEAKAVDMFLMKHNITSNKSWLPFSSNVTLITHRMPAQNLREQVYENENAPYFRLVLRMDQFKGEYYRQYMDLIELLSVVGGIVAALISAFGLIAIPYNIYKMRVTIANEIYEIHEKEAAENSNRESVEEGNEVPIGSDQMQVKRTETDGSKKKIQLLNDRFAKQLSKKRIKTSLQGFCEDYCCFWRKTPSENQILLKQIEERLQHDIDLIEVVKKLQQFEKLKDLLLSKEQREVFNYTLQPKLYKDLAEAEIGKNEEEDIIVNLLNQDYSEYDSLPKLMELYMAYRKLQEEKDPSLRRINNQIIQLLGKQMVRTLQKLDEELVVDQKLIDKINQIEKDAAGGDLSFEIKDQKGKGEDNIKKLKEPLLLQEKTWKGNSMSNNERKIIELKEMIPKNQTLRKGSPQFSMLDIKDEPS